MYGATIVYRIGTHAPVTRHYLTTESADAFVESLAMRGAVLIRDTRH